MTIAEEVYKFVIQKEIVTSEELTHFSQEQIGKDYKYIYKKYLFPFLKEGRIKRVQKGMYAAVNIYIDEDLPADRYLIATKVRPEYYLGYHSALELHGCAYSAFNTMFISTTRSNSFRPFSFENVKYQPVRQKDVDTEVITIKYRKKEIRISSPSRTFVECINRLDLVGGIEECLKSLDGLQGVDISGVTKVLNQYHNNRLMRSVGFFLEKMSDHSPFYGHIDNRVLKVFEDGIGKAPMYFDQGVASEYNKRWNLYIPKELDGLMRGI